jgi:hypothetical protein
VSRRQRRRQGGGVGGGAGGQGSRITIRHDISMIGGRRRGPRTGQTSTSQEDHTRGGASSGERDARDYIGISVRLAESTAGAILLCPQA